MLRRLCDEAGRDYDAIEKTAPFGFDVGDRGEKVGELLGQLRWLAGMGVETVFGWVVGVDRIRPLEVMGREVIPVVADWRRGRDPRFMQRGALVNEQRVRSPGAAFLLSQLGGHSSRPLGRRAWPRPGSTPREVMLFRHVSLSEGRSQREVALAVGLPASRIVAIVDRLEARGWVERRTSPRDRRAHALHLTADGRARAGADHCHLGRA